MSNYGFGSDELNQKITKIKTKIEETLPHQFELQELPDPEDHSQTRIKINRVDNSFSDTELDLIGEMLRANDPDNSLHITTNGSLDFFSQGTGDFLKVGSIVIGPPPKPPQNTHCPECGKPY